MAPGPAPYPPSAMPFPSSARLARLLAPLVVLGTVGAVVVVGWDDPRAALERERAQLEARVGAVAEQAALVTDLEAFAARHRDNPAAVDFAVELLARSHAVREAFAVWAADPERTRRSGAAARFATVALRELGTTSGDPTKLSWLFPYAIQARAEAGDGGAEGELAQRVASMSPAGILPLYAPIHRTPSRALDRLAAAFVARGALPEFRAAGAAMRARPGLRDDVAVLRELVASTWRVERPFMWQHLVRALGTVASPDDVEFLRAQRAAVTAEGREGDVWRATFDVGLALAGDAGARARLVSTLGAPDAEWAAVHWAVGLATRLAHGDASVVDDLRLLWDRSGPTARLQLGVGVLLADPAPPASIPGDAWADALEAQGSWMARVVAHSWRLRARKPAALDVLLADLRELLAVADLREASGVDTDYAAATLGVLRALARF